MSKVKIKPQKQSMKLKTQKENEESVLPKKYESWICIGIILLSLIIFYNEVVFKGKVFIAADNTASGVLPSSFYQSVESSKFPLWSPYLFSGMPIYGSLMTTGDRWFDLSHRIWSYVQSFVFSSIANPTAAVVSISLLVLMFFFMKNMRYDKILIGLALGSVIVLQILISYLNFPILLYYFLFGLSTFLFVINRGHTKLVATFTAIAIIFSTSINGWVLASHNTKIIACAFFPLILLLIDKIIEKMNWFYVAILIFVIHLEFEATHLQMTFYIYMFLGIYLLYFFIRSIKDRQKMISVLRGISVLIITTGIAFFMSADRYLSTWEYSKFSIRGTGPLVMEENQVKSTTTEGGGLSYDYATNWSFSPGEIITFIIPSYYGFGQHDYKGMLTNNQQAKINTYFGPMMFTDAPQYMGVLVFILAIIGFYYYRKNIFVQALLIISIVSLFISFGRELPVLYDLVFYHLPFFNKFRVPVMILILFQISIAIMAGYGLSAVLESYKKNPDRIKILFKYFVIGSITILVLAFLAKGALNDGYRSFFENAIKTNTETNFVQQLGMYQSKYPNEFRNIINMYYDAISSTMFSDLYFSLAIISAFFILTFLLMKEIIRQKIFYLALFGLLIVDLWRIDYRPFEPKQKKEYTDIFKKPDFVSFFEGDKSLYRVFEIDNNSPNTSNLLASYGLQNIYGYSPAKIRIYQDVVENVGIVNPFLWNLLNMKYLISDKAYQDSTLRLVYPARGNDSRNVMENLHCLPRAFFVNRYEVKDKIYIIKALRDGTFYPKDVAYLENDPNIKVEPIDTSAKVNVTGFGIHNLNMDVTASGNNLLFISEVYYPAGWKAFVDGVETPIYKTNYLFRSIIVPKGNHKVEMKFEPSSFSVGKTITLLLNILVIGGIVIYGIFFIYKQRKPKLPITQI